MLTWKSSTRRGVSERWRNNFEPARGTDGCAHRRLSNPGTRRRTCSCRHQPATSSPDQGSRRMPYAPPTQRRVCSLPESRFQRYRRRLSEKRMSKLYHCAFSLHELTELVHWQRSTQIIALDLGAVVRFEEFKLIFCFHSFCCHTQFHVLGKRDNR